MKAYLIDRYKGPLHLAEIPDPHVGPRDVLIDVHATSINQLDAKTRDGEFKQILPYRLPLVLGNDVAGVITQIGTAVTGFAIGDRVYARPCQDRIGTFAERIAVDAADLAHIPERLSMAEAASLPLVALTAWQALVERADLQAGQKVLIHAGSGGVGTIAVQLAKHLAAHVATTTGPSNTEWVRALGADVVIDYRSQDFTNHVSGYDVVLDGQGGEVLHKSLTVLRPGGLAIGIAGPPDPAFARTAGLNPVLRLAIAALSGRVRRRARGLGVRYSFLFMRASGEQLGRISELVQAGAISPVIDRVFGFEELPAALAHAESGRAKGKVVVQLR